MLNSITTKSSVPSAGVSHEVTTSGGSASSAGGQGAASTTKTGNNATILSNMPGNDPSVTTTSTAGNKISDTSGGSQSAGTSDSFNRTTNTPTTTTNTTTNTSTTTSNNNNNIDSNDATTQNLSGTTANLLADMPSTGSTQDLFGRAANTATNTNTNTNTTTLTPQYNNAASTVNLTGNLPGAAGNDTFWRSTNTSSSLDLTVQALTANDAYNANDPNSAARTALLMNMPGESSENDAYNPNTSGDIMSSIVDAELPVTNEPTYSANSELLNFFSTDDNTVLFGSENVTQSTNLSLQVAADETGQSFNAALAATAAQNPELVVGMIKPNGDSTYDVNFYVNSTQNSQSSASQSTPSMGASFAEAPVNGAQGAQLINVPMRQVTVRVSDAFLPGGLPQDASGNSIMWAALVNKAYAQLLDSGLMNAQNPNDPLATVTGRQLTVLNSETPLEAHWRALSLANAPLKIPVTAYSGSETGHPNLAPNKAFNVLGTFHDPLTNEAMVQMHRPGLPPLDPKSIFSIPLSIYQKAILTTIIADGRPAIDLVNPQDPLSAAALSNCCMMARAGSTQAKRQSDSLRVFDSPARLKENRCMSCAYARHLCMPS